MYFVDRSAVVLKPTQVFLDWLKSSDEDMPDITLAQLQSNCTTLLVPEFDTPEEVIGYIGEHFQPVFEAELAGWEVDKKVWPALDLTEFWRFFTVEVHDMVLDMVDADIRISAITGNDA
ncbi:hypothetical protein PT286_06115 [Neisseriaceae bacterium ESL0693]|nr:hypothetical protein [Neisseriaceae bacterium ESL0693]